jgi:outer membrane biosynthesis protein TonB
VFDNVGKSLDEEANKRTAKSVVYTFLLVGGSVGLFIGFAAYKAAEMILDPVDDGDLVEVVIEENMLDEAPPPPPPPPPPPAAAEEEEEEEEEEEDEPDVDEMDEEVKELDEEVKKEVASQDKPKGAVGGVEGGEEGGVEGGVVGGVEGGVIGGVLGGTLVFHHSELEVKRRIQPVYPKEAKPLNLGVQRCKVRVTINEQGVPTGAKVEDCPKVFHVNARESIMKWRWYPPRAGKERVKAQTTIVITYRLK